MSFLYPGFLFAFLLLAIPVLIHLFYFRRYKTVRFSSLRFLKNIETERKNRNRLKHLLVLFSRICALASLILAFAIPGCKERQQNFSGKKTVQIFIDNSYSMQHRNSEGIVFETAKNKAREIVKSAPLGTEFFVYCQSALPDKVLSAEDAIKTIDEMEASSRSESIKNTWQRLFQQKSKADNPNLSTYLVSDFQDAYLRELPNSSQVKSAVYGIKINGGGESNMSIDSAWLQNPFALVGENNRLNFWVSNFSATSNKEIRVKLKSGSSILGLSNIETGMNKNAVGFIDFRMPEQSKNELVLEIDDPVGAFDNELFLCIQSQGEINIELLGKNTFLESALKMNSFFKVRTDFASTQGFKGVQTIYQVVSNNLSGADCNKLIEFANKGGRVVLVPDVNMPIDGYKSFYTTLGFPEIKNIQVEPVKMQKQSLGHVFFQRVFQSIPKNVEMPTSNKLYSTGGSSGEGESVISMENGEPFLLKFSMNKGAVYVFLSPFSISSGTFVQSILFFPVVANCAFDQESSGTLYGFASSGLGYPLTQKYPSGDGNIAVSMNKTEWIAETQNGLNGKELYIGSDFNTPGFYRVYDKKEAGIHENIALNVNRLESNPKIADRERLKEFEEKTKVKWLSGNQLIGNLSQNESGTPLWHLFIWLAAAFFAVEVLILVFWDRAAQRFGKTTPTITIQ